MDMDKFFGKYLQYIPLEKQMDFALDVGAMIQNEMNRAFLVVENKLNAKDRPFLLMEKK